MSAPIARAIVGLESAQITGETFRLPSLAERLSAILAEIRAGCGFVVLRGLDVAAHSDDDVGRIFWGAGSYFGTPLQQDPRSDLLGLRCLRRARTGGCIAEIGFAA